MVSRQTGNSERILGDLRAVHDLRSRARADARLAAALDNVKRYQQSRFATTYADLLAPSSGYADAARFFLTDLYGPVDFEQRDAQFARIVPALSRLFSADIVGTVARLTELHALSERLDLEMAAVVRASTLPLSDPQYRAAWQRVDQPLVRQQQLRLVAEVGQSLAGIVRKPLVVRSLHWMHGPASAAGLGELQQFLERGLSAFASMPSTDHFLTTITQRETAFIAAMFGSRQTW